MTAWLSLVVYDGIDVIIAEVPAKSQTDASNVILLLEVTVKNTKERWLPRKRVLGQPDYQSGPLYTDGMNRHVILINIESLK